MLHDFGWCDAELRLETGRTSPSVQRHAGSTCWRNCLLHQHRTVFVRLAGVGPVISSARPVAVASYVGQDTQATREHLSLHHAASPVRACCVRAPSWLNPRALITTISRTTAPLRRSLVYGITHITYVTYVACSMYSMLHISDKPQHPEAEAASPPPQGPESLTLLSCEAYRVSVLFQVGLSCPRVRGHPKTHAEGLGFRANSALASYEYGFVLHPVEPRLARGSLASPLARTTQNCSRTAVRIRQISCTLSNTFSSQKK